MGSRRRTVPTDELTVTPNGRLTEHTAHLDIANAPTLSYPSGGRTVTFSPTKLIVRYRWTWSTGGGWVVLEVKAVGNSGTHSVNARFPSPEKAPDWVKEAITKATPPAFADLALAG
jgi:hypothetical protein